MGEILGVGAFVRFLVDAGSAVEARGLASGEAVDLQLREDLGHVQGSRFQGQRRFLVGLR